jgi:hypothetical protein
MTLSLSSLPKATGGTNEVPPSEDFPEGDAFVTREWQAAYGAPAGCVVRYLRQPFTHEPDLTPPA